MKNHICFVAGRSGGHIIPCLTLAQTIKKANPQTDLTFISTVSSLDKKLTNHPLLRYNMYLPLNNVPQGWYAYPKFFWQLIKSFMLCMLHFIYTQPKKVISTGGYVAIPVVFAARVLRIPVELWELNVQPGKAIKFLSFFAQTINICFKETAHAIKHSTTYTPYPTRYDESDKTSRAESLKNLNLETNRTTLFIIGGSQGSQELNHLVQQFLEKNNKYHDKVQIIHQTGNDGLVKMQNFYNQHKIPAHVFAYDDELARMYNAADIIISRAGAGTLAEVSFFEKKCIIVPLETKSNNHQVYNAHAIAQENPLYFTCANASSFETLLKRKIKSMIQLPL